MNKCSLRRLAYDTPLNLPTFLSLITTKGYLKDLTELQCNSNLCDEFFNQISQICHNLYSLTITITITFEEYISSRLLNLISVQKNLKHLKFYKTLKDYLTVDHL